MWLTSLVLPAAEINATTRLFGHRVFMLGIDALSSGIPGWLANPVMAVAVIAGLLDRLWLATALGGGALLLALTSFRAPASARAAGVPVEAVSFDIGFFLWLAACSMIFATSIVGWIQSRRRAAPR